MKSGTPHTTGRRWYSSRGNRTPCFTTATAASFFTSLDMIAATGERPTSNAAGVGSSVKEQNHFEQQGSCYPPRLNPQRFNTIVVVPHPRNGIKQGGGSYIIYYTPPQYVEHFEAVLIFRKGKASSGIYLTCRPLVCRGCFLLAQTNSWCVFFLGRRMAWVYQRYGNVIRPSELHAPTRTRFALLSAALCYTDNESSLLSCKELY